MINKHKSNKIKENSNTVRHLNNGTDHRHSKSCCDQSSPARRTIILLPHIDYTNILPFNSWRQSDTYICQWTRLSLVQVKVCCLINTMQSATPMMLTVNWTLWNKLQWNWRLHLWKCIGKFWSFGSSLVDCYILEIMCTSINSVLLLQIRKIWGNSPLDLLFQK